MSTRVLAAIEPDRSRWPLAGDQLYLDLDLSAENLPAGTRLTIGSVVLEVTDLPHTGCSQFSARFGADALRWISTPKGRANRMRGMYVRVVTGGTVRVGDIVREGLTGGRSTRRRRLATRSSAASVRVSGGVRGVRRIMIPPSSSSVRTGPSAVRTNVGPRQRSQPRRSYSVVDVGAQGAQLEGRPNVLVGGVQQPRRDPPPAPGRERRHRLDVARPHRPSVGLEQALHHGRVPHDPPVRLGHPVHAADGVIQVIGREGPRRPAGREQVRELCELGGRQLPRRRCAGR